MRFWNYAENGNELRIEGPIDQETWWGDEVTPASFREELEKHSGPLTVYINSPGGDVFAASQIYTMLVEREGPVTVKIDGVAASAASVIAMAGGTVLMAPTAYLMIHDPMTVAYGNKYALKEAIKTLEEIKEGIINAYELKTKLPRDRIAALMDDEGTWLNAYSAMELGFADGLIEKPEEKQPDGDGLAKAAAKEKLCVYNAGAYSRALLERIVDKRAIPTDPPAPEGEGTNAECEALRQKLLGLAAGLNRD